MLRPLLGFLAKGDGEMEGNWSGIFGREAKTQERSVDQKRGNEAVEADSVVEYLYFRLKRIIGVHFGSFGNDELVRPTHEIVVSFFETHGVGCLDEDRVGIDVRKLCVTREGSGDKLVACFCV